MTRIMRRMRRGDFHLNIVRHGNRWLLLSGIVILVCVASLYLRNINAGLEFRGGTAFEVQSKAQGVDVPDVREALGRAGVDEATVQQIGDRGFHVETRHLSRSQQADVITALSEVTEAERGDINVQDVGPKWGRQITNKAIQALFIFFGVVILYMSIRLEPKMAGAAMVALVHDLVLTAGIYSLAGFVVTPATVIALLTILGYSLYDTVVIFDRVKERTSMLSAAGNVTYTDAANASINEVLMRSLNTSITGLLPVGSLLFVGSFLLGAQTLRELALALFVGLAAGTYSSIFIATPLLARWKEREQRWTTLRARIAARRSEAAPVTSPRGQQAASSAVPMAATPPPAATVVATPPPARSASPSQGSQPRGGSSSGARRRKKRKRKKR